MNAGHYISGIGHVGLIGLLLFGGVPMSDPEPIEVSDVSIISSEEFAMLMATSVPPVTDSALPQVPQPPEATPQAPEIADLPDEPVNVPQDAQAPAPESEPDAVPDVPEPLPPVDVVETPPELAPVAEELVPPAPLAPQISSRPHVRPVPRIAPVPVAPPAPDVAVDEVVREAAVPDIAAETATPQEQPTAPQEAISETVPEDQQADVTTSAAPTRSARPRARPNRPQPPATPNTETATSDGQADAIAAALAEAATVDVAVAQAPSGPPLTGGEKDTLRLAVSACWNTGSLSSEALRSTVVIGFDMREDGKPVTASIRLISSSGGSDGAAKQAFETARRAIIRCGARGYNLPIDKYAHWREIEMTFNPEKMRIK